MRRDLVTSIVATVVFTVLLGILYPLAITAVSQVAFPGDANGQKVYFKGRVVGSRIIGQQFATVKVRGGRTVQEGGIPVTEPDPRYFQPRPSATKPAYDGAESTFSNLGPNSKLTEEAISERIGSYLAMEKPYVPGLTAARVPVDAATASASGLDPEISEANARIQAHRVASIRHLPLGRIDGLIARYTSGRGLGFSGEPGVNVLELNLAVDRLTESGV